MKPMHGEFKRLSRCSCCHSKYSKHGGGAPMTGKKIARRNAKLSIKKDVES